MNKLLRDSDGSVLVELTLVIPLLLVVTLGTIDLTFMLYDWALANKAAFAGARAAVVAGPVATGIATPDSLTWSGQPGTWCFEAATGTTNGNCPSIDAVCTPDNGSGGVCSDGSAFDNGAFCRIFTGSTACPATPLRGSMRAAFPRLQRENVQISYQSNGLGFVRRPGGVPMNVTVSIRCMTHDFYFIGALVGYFTGSPWGYTALPGDCPDTTPAAMMPAFATTLPSEDMETN